MKVCFISNGDSAHTKRWTSWFAGHGHEVHLISPNCGPVEGVHIHHVPIDKGFYLPREKIRRQIKDVLKKAKPDILHAHQISGYGMYGALSRFHPFVVSPWGSDITSFPEESLLNRAIAKMVLKRADLVVCIDDHIKERVRQLAGHGQNARVIRWGVDCNLFKPMNVPDVGRPRILHLMKSQKPYGIETLLEAMPKIVRRHGDAEFMLLKSGNDIRKTEKAIRDMDMGGHVEFMNPVPNHQLPEIMNMSYLYVDTFHAETGGGGIGMTALEAMACAIPAVLSDTAGVEYYIKTGINGCIYKGKDSQSLADAICRLLEDREARDRIANEGRRYVMENQNWDDNMKEMESAYMQLAGGV